MQIIAIDIGSRKSQVCVRDERGQVLHEGSSYTIELPELLKKRPRARVILETSSEAFALARAAKSAGHEVVVVPSIFARALGVGSRGLKTDRRDAQHLSAAAARTDELPSVHVPSAAAQALREINTSREALVNARTKLVNNVRGFLRSILLPVKCTPRTLPSAVRKCLAIHADGVPVHIDRVLTVIETLTTQIDAANKELSELAKSNPVTRLLMTIPGTGPVTATRFVGAIDDTARFASAAAVTSYLGLTPGERSSGRTERRTGMTKAGPSTVRRALGQAALQLWRIRPDDPAVRWARRVAERRGKPIAIIALCRKLAGVMYAMWRDRRPYNPTKAAQMDEPACRS
jgi:transposase